MGKQQILIIGADPGIEKNLSDILKSNGFKPLNAKNGTEGLELLEQYSVNLVIIDFPLPDIPGIKLFDRIKADHPSIEIIILTDNASLDFAIEAINKGAFSYLPKPYEIDQTILHVRRAFEKLKVETKIPKRTVEPKKANDQTNKKNSQSAKEIAVEVLKGDEAYFRSLVENSSDIITILNKDGTVRYISPSVKHIAGFKQAEFTSVNVFEYVHPDDIPVAKDVLERAIQNPGAVLSAELRLRHNDGSWHIYETTPRNLLENEAVKGIVINSHDITERKQAERDLFRERNRLQTLLNFYRRADTLIHDIESFIVEEVIKITESSLGFFGLINGDETFMKAHLWSKQAMEECSVDFKPVEFSIKNAGIWAEAVREHNPLIINDYSMPDPRKKGYPVGHVRIRRLMSIPIIRNSKAVAIMTVANKQTNYNETDIPHLSLFLENAWSIVMRKKAEEALADSEQKLKAVVYGSPIPQFFIDRNHRVVYWNDALAILTGIEASEVIGTNQHWRAFSDVERPCMVDLAMEGVTKGIPKSHQIEYTKSKILPDAYETTDYFPLLGEGGKWLHRTAVIIRNAGGQIIGALETVEDITKRKQAEEEILAISITDQLTGLYNRRGFLNFTEQQIKLSDRSEKGLMLFFADVDGMKWINDTLGHEEGDNALIEAAGLLKRTFRASDIVARMGGDEFAILAIAAPESNPEIFTNRLQGLIDERNNEKNRVYRLSVSIGCAYYDPRNPLSLNDLMSKADKRMYEDKNKKKKSYIV